jgi:CRISPR-associated endoribonuclease Cas6
MLTAIVMNLQPIAEARLPVSHGALAYASALELFLRLDPHLSRSLHDDSTRKPLTVSPLFGPVRLENGERVFSSDTIYPWRITGLTPTVSECLARLAPTIGGVRLQEAVFTIGSVARLREEHSDAGQDGYEALLRRWAEQPLSRTVRFRFITPTTFRVGRWEQPFPLPRWVFGSLLRTWNAFASEPFDLTVDELESRVILSNWQGETRRVELGGSRTVGCIGTFGYRIIDPSPELCRIMAALAEFAFYAGVGWQTTRGLGQVRPTFSSS